MKIYIAEPELLARLLDRRKRRGDIGYEIDLGFILREILAWANELVPSESGSIFLDDPVLKLSKKPKKRLYFSACFGKGSASLVGAFLPDVFSIAGEAYRSGRPCISKDVRKDPKFYAKIDEKTRHKTKSIVCAPIAIDGSIIGVIELINKRGRISYERKDLTLLKIFADYTATLIHNSLLAKNFADMSKRDYLTGLYNNRYFFYILGHEIRKAIRKKRDVAVIFLDLDHFKDVNDTLGHLAGSRVLTEVAKVLEEIFLGAGAVLSRYGGDEFVVALPPGMACDAIKYAEEIRDRICRNTFLGGGGGRRLNMKRRVTCSVGVSYLSEIGNEENNGKIADALIRSADSAMYTAKRLGRNRIFHSSDKGESTVR